MGSVLLGGMRLLVWGGVFGIGLVLGVWSVGFLFLSLYLVLKMERVKARVMGMAGRKKKGGIGEDTGEHGSMRGRGDGDVLGLS